MRTITTERKEAEKVIELLKKEYPQLLNTIERNLKNWGDEESLVDIFVDNIKTFKEFDQGSLSFTITSLRHAGIDEAYGVLECIDRTVNKN